MPAAGEMLSLLRDPADRGPLQREGGWLVNRTSARRYPIIDGVPVLLDSTELGQQNRKFQRMYDWMSYIYDLGMKLGDLVNRGRLSGLRRMLAAKAGVARGDCCLYTSIGTGADIPFLADRVPLESIRMVGLDLSMGMLRRCQPKLRGFEDTSLLVQANAERLPFDDRTFDVVVHVGGINFFDQPALAIREMLRVAKPGAMILVSDETKQVVTGSYQKNLLTRAYFKGASTAFNPREWVPPGVETMAYEEVWDGKGYVLTFRAPLVG